MNSAWSCLVGISLIAQSVASTSTSTMSPYVHCPMGRRWVSLCSPSMCLPMMRVRSKSFGSMFCVGVVGFAMLVLVSCGGDGFDVFVSEGFLDGFYDFVGEGFVVAGVGLE